MYRTSRHVTNLTALFIILFAITSAAPSSAADKTPTETQVIFFTPAIPPGQPQEGSCWTRSIAVDRPGVWRCTIGNAIHDPCFQVPPDPNQLVCDADPALGKAGFVMKLTKPLPMETAPPANWPSPWIMQLADGSVCEPYTGTRPAVNGEPAPWFCIKPGVPPSPRTNSLVTKVNPGKVWTVDRYAESAASMGPPTSERRRVEARVVPVVKVWQ